MERSRRDTISKKKQAEARLAALDSQLASGKKRLDVFEVEEEEQVYEVLDEKAYSGFVSKRRKELGGFVVGKKDTDYVDIGEEEDWETADRDYSEEEDDAPEEEDGAAQKPKKRRGDKAASEKKSGKKQEQEAPKIRTDGLKKLFAQAQAAQSQLSKKRKADEPAAGADADGDNFLDDVLAGIGSAEPASLSRPRPAAGPGASSLSRPATLFSPANPRPWPGAQSASKAFVTPASNLSRGSTFAAARTAPAPAAPQQWFDEDDFSAGPMAPMDDEPAPAPGHGAGAFEAKLDAVAGASPAAAGAMRAPPPRAPASAAAAAAATPAVPAPLLAKAEGPTPASAAPAAAVEEENAEPEVGEHVAGWASVFTADADAIAERDAEQPMPAADGSLPLDADSTLPFFFLDAHEDAAAPGTVFLFGKVPIPAAGADGAQRDGGFVSACAAVENLQRCIYAVPPPDSTLFADESGEIAALERRVADGDAEAKLELMRLLQQRAGPLKLEVRELLMARGVTKFSMRPVKRSYAFEREDVPRAAQYVLKVKYPAAQAPLPSDLKGRHFCALFGTQASCVELLVLKRKVMGPSWLALKGAVAVAAHEQRSWCKLEVKLAGHKAVGQPAPGPVQRESPPAVVAAVHLVTVLNHQTNANEIAGASVVVARAVNIDTPMPRDEWNNIQQLRHFSVVRRLDGVSYPPGWDAIVHKENAQHPVAKVSGSIVLSSQANEKALLCFLLARLHQMDPDVLVGHNISGFDLDVLLHRLQANKVPNWSRIGRLRRTKMPNLNAGGKGGVFGSGAGAGAMSAIAGRLLADTYLAAREYSREVSYTLTALAKNQLNLPRVEIPAAEVPRRYNSAQHLMELLRSSEADAWLALGLLFHFSVLPLTRQLTCLSGSLWNKTLAGARAQRIEYLLLHEFHEQKFLLPDKLPFKERARIARAAEEDEAGDDGEEGGAGAGGAAAGDGKGKGAGGKRRGPPAYAGGLVLEPKKGLYDKYILLLDFNSLYPSIIQEYNICFSTVERPRDGGIAPLPPAANDLAILPSVLRRLVQRRRQVKDLLKNERNPLKKRQLDIRQQALKLTANSMYGCLGFANSRFYAKPLAELVTSQGREILQSTVDLVQSTLNLEVIYGDTDSIMINTGMEDLAAVKKIGLAVKKEVNKRYRLLEIEMDGVFKSMLLLKKKKYAALKLEERPDGRLDFTVEAKGLDIVRRDWSPLSKDIGNKVLQEILSGRPTDDVVASIHEMLRSFRSKLEAGEVPMDQFVITKALTKRPEDYPDGNSQPHVQVALRRIKQGKRDGVASGETVPYVICVEVPEGQGGIDAAAAKAALEQPPAGGKALAERAFHPEEVTKGGKLAVDVNYYLAQQLHPVVARLCTPISGCDAGQLAECLGLDPSRFRGSAAAGGQGSSAREEAMLGARLDDEARYAGCTPLKLRNRAGQTFDFPGVAAVVEGKVAAEALLGGDLTGAPSPAAAGATPTLTARMLANQVKVAADAMVAKYYDGWMRSDDEMYPCDTRQVSLRAAPGAAAGTAPPDNKCGGRMSRVVTEQALYTQLAYFRRLLDVQRALQRVPDGPKRQAAAARVAPVAQALAPALETIEAVCSRSSYRWVNVAALCAPVA